MHESRVARNKTLKKARAQHDIMDNADLGAATAFNKANPVKHKQHASDIYLTDPKALKAAGFTTAGSNNPADVVGKAVKAASNAAGWATSTGFGGKTLGDKTTEKVTGKKPKADSGVAAIAKEVSKNLGRELVDIPANIVPSTYQIAKDPKSAPKQLAEPFVELAKHPGKSLEEHPLSSLLMVSGAEGALARGASKTLRTIPTKATRKLGSTARPAASTTVPGTNLENPGTYSKDLLVKGLQAGFDKASKREPGVMTPAQIKRRVDEHVAAVPGRGAGHFADDFAVRGKSGKIHAIHGRDNAVTAAEQASGTGVEMTPFPLPDSGGRYAIVPKAAADRLHEHIQQGAPPNTSLERGLQMYNKAFRQNVLALSPKWFTGNVAEAATRSLVAHAGPRSYYTAHRALAELKRIDLEAHDRLRNLAAPGGQAHLVGTTEHSASDILAGTRVANIAKSFSAGKPAEVWKHYTHFVFDQLNGRIESQFQKAALGKSLRESPLMSDRTLKVSNKAIEEAAQGMRDTNAQVQLAREVDRIYGKYNKFTPSMRHAVNTYTPFVAWTMNSFRFLFDVLPRDHPALTALLASANQASEDWRKDHGLLASLGTPIKGALPGWLQGSIPGKKGSHLRASHYGPAGLFSSEGGSGGTVASALLPQIMSVVRNMQGEDFKGSKLGGGEGTNWLAAALSLVENTIPGATIEAQLSGKHLPNQAKGATHPATLGGRLRKQFDPFAYTPAQTKKKRKRKLKSKALPDILGGKDSGGLPDILN